LGENAKEMGKQIETINRELQQDWTLPSVYQRALRNVQHYGQTTMMELVHFMFIQARYVFRGRIPDEHHHNLFHNFIMPVIAAYGPAGECVVEEVEEMMPRIKQYIDWVANEMGVGFVSLVLHLMSHCDIIVKDQVGCAQTPCAMKPPTSWQGVWCVLLRQYKACMTLANATPQLMTCMRSSTMPTTDAKFSVRRGRRMPC